MSWGSSPRMRGARGCASRLVPRRRDHPRVCGEHLDTSHRRLQVSRIIPAYAGSTLILLARPAVPLGSSPRMRGARRSRRRSSGPRRDHPRVCGEHGELHVGRAPRRGIIPAYAGSTSIEEEKRQLDAGSSPRMRGAPRGPPPTRST